MIEAPDRQRIDKWLWFARVVKSRSLAQKLVAGGKVRVNREKTDQPSRLVREGDVLTITLERQVLVLEIRGAGTRRGPAPEAQTLYLDRSPPVTRETPPVRGGPRPTKRDRRALDDIHSSAGREPDGGFTDDDDN
jgi:ribosome-associated heat shock protein Hsp15